MRKKNFNIVTIDKHINIGEWPGNIKQTFPARTALQFFLMFMYLSIERNVILSNANCAG